MDSGEIEEVIETAVGESNSYISSYGKPGLSIDIAYIRAALALLVAGAVRLQAQKVVNTSTNEDPITYLLDKEMRLVQHASANDIIRWVIQPNIQRDPIDPLLRCVPDFMFIWEDEEADPDLCLYAEAKKLFGTGPSLADKYVEEGLLDFVEARYGRNHNFGIMVGYILKGPLNQAVSSVQRAMNVRKMKTAEQSEFTLNNSLCSHPYTHHSSHLQRGATAPMTLVHLFLDFS